MDVLDHRRLEPQRSDHGKGRPSYSRFRGVSWHRKKRVWVAFVAVNGRQLHVASLPPTRAGEVEAARLRDDALMRLGFLTGLNFPLD